MAEVFPHDLHCISPEVYSGGLLDISDEMLVTPLRTVVMGQRLI